MSSVSTTPEMLERIMRSGHVVVTEGPEDEHDGVDFANARKELVAEPLTLRGPCHQPADVVELHGGVHDA